MKWLACLLFLFGCQSAGQKQEERGVDAGRLKVLATTAIVADLIESVGGELVSVSVLIKGDLDPHSYQLVKGDDEKLAYADLIVSSGLGLEHGPSLSRYLQQSDKTLSLGSKLLEHYPELVLRVKGQLDPHAWMDMSLWSKNIPFVVEALSKRIPEKKSYFEERGKALTAAWMAQHEAIKKVLHEIPSEKRYLVTSHDAFNYFARAYLSEEKELQDGSWEPRFRAPEGLAPESQLSLKNISDILDHVEKYKIHVIFPESNVSADSLKKIKDAASQRGFEIVLGNPYLYGDAMGPPGSDGDTYPKMLMHNAKTVAEDLKL